MELTEKEILITQSAFDKFLEKKIQTNLGLQFELDLISPYCTYIREQRQDLKVRTAKKFGTLHLWLTINPDEKKTTFEKFRDKCHAVSNRSMIESSYYCFEQRGVSADDCGKGYHCHMLLTRNIDYNQKKIIDNLKNSFKNFTNINDFHLFNYHWTPEEFIPDKIEYMTGTKVGDKEEQKQLKQEIDKLFRQKKNLKEYYKTCRELADHTIEKEKVKTLDIEKDLKNKVTPMPCTTLEFPELSN